MLGGGNGGGFFGSGGKSTETTTNTQSTNTGAQIGDESFGFTFGGANIQTGGGKKSSTNVDYTTNNTVIQTDQGAIKAATDFARDALELPGLALDAVVDATAGALDTVIDAQDRSFEFSENLFGNSLDFAGDFSTQQSKLFTDFARGIVSQSLDQVGDTVQRSQDSLGDTVTALNTIAREQSKSTDERLTEIVKYVLYTLGAIGLAWALVAGSKS